MKAARVSFMQMMLFIRRDMMLFASCAAPLLAGVFFRFAVPVICLLYTSRLLGP